MSQYTKNFLTGVFIICACLTAAFFIMFLKPSVGDMKKTYYLRFADINKVLVGTRVDFAGKPIGEVVKIEDIANSRYDSKKDKLGRLYTYQVTIKIDSKVDIYSSDLIFLETSGLMGERSIAISPKALNENNNRLVPEGEILYAQSGDMLENTIANLSELTTETHTFLNQLNNWIEKNGNQLSHSIESFDKLMCKGSIILDQMNEHRLIESTTKMVENMELTSKRIQQGILLLDKHHFFENTAYTMENFRSFSASCDLIGAKIVSPNGLLNQVMTNAEWAKTIEQTLKNSKALLEAINNYGFLFHLNKKWQREKLTKGS